MFLSLFENESSFKNGEGDASPILGFSELASLDL
jgi:hypothetical protein